MLALPALDIRLIARLTHDKVQCTEEARKVKFNNEIQPLMLADEANLTRKASNEVNFRVNV